MITLNFDEVLKRVYNAKKGVEVRYGLGQGFEYCKQFADEAQGYATNAKASEKKASDAVANIDQQKADSVAAVQQAQTTATTAITQTKDAALTDIDNAKTGALQEVANSTEASQTAATKAKASEQAAEKSKEAADASAFTAGTKASEASASATQADASQKKAAKNQQAAEEAANRASAIVSTDKTLSIENAPADAAAVRKLIEESLAAQRAEDYARIKFWVSDDPTSPASFIGGTWERVEDCTIWGASDTHPAGTTVEAGLPSVFGQVNDILLGDDAQGSGALKITFTPVLYGNLPNGSGKTIYRSNVGWNNTGIYGTSNTVQPPAYCLYIWRRVA